MKVGAINPITNNKMDLSLRGIGGLLLGGLILWGIAGTTQAIGRTVTNRVNNQYVDFSPESLNNGEVKIVDQVAVYG
jgi:hypothetical protein